MSVSFVAVADRLLIASGSNTSQATRHHTDAAALGFITPGTLDALDFTIEVSPDNANWTTYKVYDGSDFVAYELPPASSAVVLVEPLAFPYLRIKASGNVGADRTIIMTKHFTTS